MFCRNCGKEIPDDSVFCPECGGKCSDEKRETIISNEDTHKILEFFLNSLKKPVTTIKEKGEELSSSIHIGIITVITLLIPLIHLGVLKTLIGKGMNLYADIIQVYSNSIIDLKDRLKAKTEINAFIDTYVPFTKIYILDILSFIIFFGVMLLLIYLVYKFVFKAYIETEKFLATISVALILKLAFTILSAAVLFISIVPAIIINVIGNITILVVIILGMREVTEEEDKLSYIFAISYGIGMIASAYFSVNYIVSTIQSYFISLIR